MKNKNVILGTAAVVFAVGSAFAAFAPIQVYVRAKTSASQANFTLQPVSRTCESSGTQPCMITVSSTSHPSGIETVRGRSTSNALLFNTSATAIDVTAISFYDVE